MFALHGALIFHSVCGLQPLILMVNVALAVPFAGMSPSTIGKLPGAVTTGEHEWPSSCVSVNPLICVAYAVPTLPLVAVSVTFRVSRVPAAIVAVNFSP